MKPSGGADDYFAEYNEDFNKKDPRFKVGDHVRISKYKNIFDTLQIGRGKSLLIVKLKISSFDVRN